MYFMMEGNHQNMFLFEVKRFVGFRFLQGQVAVDE